jgi:uncharacterized protein YuzE
MKKPRMFYFAEGDILYLVIAEGEEASSVELSPDILAELNVQGEAVGIEILNASTFVRDTLIQEAQAKHLNLINLQSEAQR